MKNAILELEKEGFLKEKLIPIRASYLMHKEDSENL